MKKMHSTNLARAISLGTAIAVLLSSVSPIFASNISITGEIIRSTNGTHSAYLKGSHGSIVFSGDDDYCGVDHVIDRGSSSNTAAAISAENQYERFINDTNYRGRNPYGVMTNQATWEGDGLTTQNSGYMGNLTGGAQNVLPEAYGIYSFVTGCGAYASGNYSTAFGAGATAKSGGAQAFGVSALASGKTSVAVGVGSEASGTSSVALGGLTVASADDSISLGVRTKAGEKYAIAIGSRSEAQAKGSIAIGGSDPVEENGQKRYVLAKAKNSIAIGASAYAEKHASVAIGDNAQVRVDDGVAIGGGSRSITPRDTAGYDPALHDTAKNEDSTWKSTSGAFAIGDADLDVTRQITGVAAGIRDTDAVNLAQLRAVEDLASGVWNISVNGKDKTEVRAGNSVNFLSKTGNLIVEKNTDNDLNNIQFGLSDNLRLASITTGGTSLSADGLVLKGGPRVTSNGIFAGGKVITGLADGTDDTDAVTVAQLNAMKGMAEGWNLSVNKENSTAVGAGSKVDFSVKNNNLSIIKDNDNNVKFGLSSDITLTSVTTGKTSMQTYGLVIIGGPKVTSDGIFAGNKKIKGIEDGDITSSSDEAVTGKQINKFGQDIAGYFGGNSSYDSGVWTAPSFMVNKIDDKGIVSEKKYNNVAEALKDIDSSISNVYNKITNAQKDSLVKQQHDVAVITIGEETGGNEIRVANKSDVDRKISGVKDAEYADEAVNKKQLDKSIASAVLYDKAGERVDYSSITLGGGRSGGAVALRNVKDGEITSQSLDAVNGGQVDAIGQSVAFYFGGDTKFNNGVFTDPNYRISTVSPDGSIVYGSYNNVGTALSVLDNSIRGINTRITYESDNLTQKIDNLSQQALLWNEDDQAFVAIRGKGSDRKPRKIKFLADGEISAQSTDAINGHQFYVLGSNVAKYFGGGASYNNGVWTAPNFTVGKLNLDGTVGDDKSYNNVADALKGVNSYITSVYNQVSNAAQNSLVKQESYDSPITVGGATGGDEISITNKSNEDRKILGVKDAEQANEAVNKGQLDKSIKDVIDSIKDIKDLGVAAVLYDKKNGNVDYGSITLGGDHSNNSVALRNVKDGKIAKQSHDAINGGQIDTIAKNIASYFGGGMTFMDGVFTQPSYSLSVILSDGSVGRTNVHNVDDALASLDINIDNVNSRLTSKVNEFTENALLWSEGDQAFVSLHKSAGVRKNSKITYLLDGEISSRSTDAVNGKQLYTVISNVASYFGGGAKYDDGKWIAPTFEIGQLNLDGSFGANESYNNVADALKGVNSYITSVYNQVSNGIRNSLVKQNLENSPITIGVETGGNEIRITNKSNGDRTISGVKAAEKGDEAVNKRQLDGHIEIINNDIKNIRSASAFAVLYDKRDGGSVDYGRITLGGDKYTGPVALRNVRGGEINQQSLDAVNGGQIYTIGQNVALYFGGDTEFNNGVFTGPNYRISTVSPDGSIIYDNYTNVGTALSALGNSIGSINTRIMYISDNFTQKIDNLSQQALLWSEDDKAFVAIRGKGADRKPRKIKFLAEGEISSGSTDAINGKQLYVMGSSVARYFGGKASYENGVWTAPNFKVAHIEGNVAREENYDNVAEALGDVSKSIINVNNRISEIKDQVGSDVLRWNSIKDAYDATRGGRTSKIVGVADGLVTQNSTDAINGGQLWKTNERVKDVEQKVDYIDRRVDNISSTVTDMGKTIFNIENKVNGITDGAVVYDKDRDGKKTNKITLVGGDEGVPVLIDNLSDGRIESGSKEAVNGGQLYDYTKQQMQIILNDAKQYTDQRVNNIVVDAIDDAVEQSKHYTDLKFENLNYNIEIAQKEARQSAAIGLAVANLRYNDTPGKLSIAFGSGLWRSQSALAFGAGYTSENGNIRSNLSVTSSGGHWGIGAGFNMTLN
ncbi:Vomp family autotransporter [Bartonella sp. B41]